MKEGIDAGGPVDIAIVRAQRVIFHFLSLLFPWFYFELLCPDWKTSSRRRRLRRRRLPLSGIHPSDGNKVEDSPPLRPPTRILAPFREEERAILLPCQRRGSKGGWSQLNLDGSLAIRVLEGIPPSLRDWVIQKFRGFPSKQFRPSDMLPSVVLRSGQAIRYLQWRERGEQ